MSSWVAVGCILPPAEWIRINGTRTILGRVNCGGNSLRSSKDLQSGSGMQRYVVGSATPPKGKVISLKHRTPNALANQGRFLLDDVRFGEHS
jgi:hypothetical protein